MNQQQALAALHSGRVLAGQLEASRTGYTAWVGVYPLRQGSETAALLRRAGREVALDSSQPLYRIRCFELADAVRNTWFGETDMENLRERVAVGDSELFAGLEELDVPIDCLRIAGNEIDYPI